MVISNYRLPEVELATEKTLNDDDVAVSAALKVIANCFERAQERTRDIIKAYNELKSITANILKEHREDCEKSSKNDPGKSPVDKNGSDKSLIDNNVPGKSLIDKNEPVKLLIDKNVLKNKTSTPKAASCEQKINEKEQKKIEMIDLTAVFGFTLAGKRAESRSREISPELGERRQRNSKKPITVLSQNDSRQNFKDEHGKTSENQGIPGNEENSPPFYESSLNNSPINDSMLHTNESRPIAKIGFAKTLYTIERSKIPNGKPSKQSKLIFQPLTTKIDPGSSSKIDTKSDIFDHCDANLFDEDYRTKKRMKEGENSRQSKEQSTATIVKNSTETGSNKKAAASIDKMEFDEREKKLETVPLIPTASQIDETARSLFDDDDVDDFGVSHDLLNMCVRSPVVADLEQEIEEKDNVGSNKIIDGIASTSSTSLFAQSRNSIDETFFAPAELMRFKSEAKSNIITDVPVAGCSTIAKTTDAPENNRTLKRKFGEEAVIDAENDLGDLGLQDINWDAEIANDDWTTCNRPINNSFDMPPERKTNSPKYAHKGNVERNKAKRSKLPGWDCRDCEKYYGKLDLPEDELRMRMKACSRHKSKYNQRYYTPAGFWDPDFPDTTDSSDCGDN